VNAVKVDLTWVGPMGLEMDYEGELIHILAHGGLTEAQVLTASSDFPSGVQQQVVQAWRKAVSE
jgi:hypothetical protein